MEREIDTNATHIFNVFSLSMYMVSILLLVHTYIINLVNYYVGYVSDSGSIIGLHPLNLSDIIVVINDVT